MKRLIIGCIISITLFSCGEKSSKPSDSKLFGLASPIQLNWGSNQILLTDYFPDDLMIDSISIDAPITFGLDEQTGMVLLIDCAYGDLPRLMNMTIFAEKIPYSILLKSPVSKKISFTYPASNEVYKVEFKGTFTNWTVQNFKLDTAKNLWQFESFVDPGKHQYKFIVNGAEINDPNNPDSISNGLGGSNSVLKVDFRSYSPEMENDHTPRLTPVSFEGNSINIKSENVDHLYAYWNNFRLDAKHVGDGNYELRIPPFCKDFKRSHIRVYGWSAFGISNDLLIPLSKNKVVAKTTKLNSNDWHSSIMYFMMVDRFVDGDSSNNEPVNDPAIHPKANYYGGDLAGITGKIKEGYFRELGINTLWISPITQNPLDAWGQFTDPDVKYSGYHGYWPISSSKVDHRFGTSDELKNLIDVAHENGISVLLDYVANHVHQQHPVYKQHPDWVTDLYLPDGSLNTERWDDHRLTTWFDTFMPTLDLTKPEVARQMVDSAAYWVEEYDFDGFRHDATKHIPENFWRLLTKRVKERSQKRGQNLYQIGETYGSRELIKSYIGSGMLDGQFDFNLYDQALSVFASDDEGWARLADALVASISAYGEHHLMGNISGNQDKPRFISFADGSMSFDTEWLEYKRIGLKQSIGIADTNGYKKLALFHAFNMTIPGIPIVYYGDEIGMPGAGDPDNRRMMRFAGLSEHEKNLQRTVAELAAFRRNHMALNYGTLKIYWHPDALIYTRQYFDDIITVIFNKKSEPVVIDVPAVGKQKLEPYSFKLLEHAYEK